MPVSSYSVFEYLYRDAANYKAFGRILLRGEVSADDVQIVRTKLETGELFIAEQVGVPPLREQLWADCGSVFDSGLDHAWHEFMGFRLATAEEATTWQAEGTACELVQAFARVDQWDVRRGGRTPRVLERMTL